MTPKRLVPRLPLPPYRYLPGRTPHPLRSPEGHLRTRRIDDAPKDHAEAIRYGFDLFAAAFYWEAHEAWEGAWHSANGDERLVLQSLIQLAAGHLKRELGATSAARRLYVAANARLESITASTVLGVSLKKLESALQRSLEAVDSPPGTPESLLDRRKRA